MDLVNVALFLALSATVYARTFTILNQCPYVLWPAIYTDPNAGNATPNYSTGQVSRHHAFQTVQFEVPDNWHSGRIWVRRNCDFSSGIAGPQSCLNGGCIGGLECDAEGGTGVPPATLAEFTFQGGNDQDTDFYDLSLVDGFNVPMKIAPSISSCATIECAVDLAPNCPPELVGPSDPFSNYPVGCISACKTGNFGDPSNSPSCCSGSYATNCTPAGIPYYSYFKSPCPNAVVCPGEPGQSCPSASKADYTITFCP